MKPTVAFAHTKKIINQKKNNLVLKEMLSSFHSLLHWSRALYNLRALRKNTWLSSAELEKMQLKRLRNLLSYADENVRFYHQRFKQAKFNPKNMKSVEDLCNIPVLTKADVQKNFDSLVSKRVDVEKCSKEVTSGSTGNPLAILTDKRSSYILGANRLRHYVENGGRLFKDKYALLTVVRKPVKRTALGSLLEHLGIFKKVKFSTQSPIEEVLKNLVEFGPDVIDSYPSFLILLARELEERKKWVSPRLMFGFGEMLDDNSRKIINSAFGTEILDTYGCVEAGDVAWECSEHIGYHINEDLITTEFVKDNEPVAAGESGEIILTPLWNYAMPLIRYKIGDVGKPCDESCPCGRGLPLMKILEGRFEDFIILPNGKIISPLNNLTYFDNFECVAEYRIIQERTDKLVLQVVLKEGYKENVFEKFKDNFINEFGEDVTIEIEVLDSIPRMGKFRRVVSKILPREQFILSMLTEKN